MGRSVSRAASASPFLLAPSPQRSAFRSGVALGGETGASLIGLSVVLPALLAQDAWRFGFFAANRGRDAFVNDAVWAVVLGVGFALAVMAGATEPATYVVLWGLGAAAGSVLGVVQSRLLPQPTAVRSWWAEHADLIPRFSAESIARMGDAQLTYYAISVIGGLIVVGTLRAGELILGPFNILFQGVHLVALPEAVRLLKESESALGALGAAAERGHGGSGDSVRCRLPCPARSRRRTPAR